MLKLYFVVVVVAVVVVVVVRSCVEKGSSKHYRARACWQYVGHTYFHWGICGVGFCLLILHSLCNPSRAERNYRWETSKRVDGEVFVWGALLSSKWLQTLENDMVNYQNHYLTNPCNILKYIYFIDVCVQSLKCNVIFQCRGWAYGMPKEIPKTIPKRYLYWNDIVMASLKFDWARTHNMNRQSWTRRIANLYISDLWYVPKHFKAIHSELWKTILISHRAPSHIEFWLPLRCFLWPVCTIIQGVGGIRCIMLHNVPMLIPIFKRIFTRQNVQHFCRHGRMIFLANTIHIIVLSSACGHEKLDGLKRHKQI